MDVGAVIADVLRRGRDPHPSLLDEAHEPHTIGGPAIPTPTASGLPPSELSGEGADGTLGVGSRLDRLPDDGRRGRQQRAAGGDAAGGDSRREDADLLDLRAKPPLVAIVGRPNVGKSTLVNRILGRREAVVEDVPGVTRDRVTYDANWRGRAFMLVDTGGWEPDALGLQAEVSAQAEIGAFAADVVVMVVDATVGRDRHR